MKKKMQAVVYKVTECFVFVTEYLVSHSKIFTFSVLHNLSQVSRPLAAGNKLKE